MSKLPSMPLFFGDFLASTAAWDGEEQGLYLLLLGYQWSSGPLPRDPKRLARMVRYDAKAFAPLWEVVSTKFSDTPDGLANPRLEEIRIRANEIANRRAEAGARGGLNRVANEKQVLKQVLKQMPQQKLKQTCKQTDSKNVASALANATDLLSHPVQSSPVQSNPVQSSPPGLRSSTAVGPERPTGDERADERAGNDWKPDPDLPDPACSDEPAPDPVERIFDHWRSTHCHPKARLDAKRRKLIRAALDGYSEADLCQAISGYRNSPHHMGQNDRATVFDSIELLLRDAEHIDAGLRFYGEPPRTDLSSLSRRNVAAIEDWEPPEVRRAAG